MTCCHMTCFVTLDDIMYDMIYGIMYDMIYGILYDMAYGMTHDMT